MQNTIQEFNPEIIKKLNIYKIPVNEGLAILLLFHYNLTDITLNDEKDVIVVKLLASNIINYDAESNIQWNIPLFENQEVTTNFEWVKKEYCELFKQANHTSSGYYTESTIRMKSLFAKNPHIRKDDVIEATKLYLRETDHKYIGLPHFFITKGKGVDKVEKLLTWIENLKSFSTPEHIEHSSKKWS